MHSLVHGEYNGENCNSISQLACVHSTTQPAYISSSTYCAGVAATAGELAKDEKHLAAVEKA